MKKEEEILIWNYLEGNCAPDETRLVESKINGDSQFKKAYLERLRLHEELSGIEAEQPSMRFSVNVLERLPDLYGTAGFEPLIPPLWRKVFVSSFVFLIAALFILALQNGDPSSASGSTPLNEWTALINQQLTALSAHTMTIVASVSISLILLFGLDRKLRSVNSGQ